LKGKGGQGKEGNNFIFLSELCVRAGGQRKPRMNPISSRKGRKGRKAEKKNTCLFRTLASFASFA
jgi:hypothetical protein